MQMNQQTDTHTHTSHNTQPAKARLVLLQRKLHRAARCLLDARLHSGQWGFERCCAYLQEQGLSPTDEAAATEVLGYSQKPGYAMAAFVGHEELVALRRGREAAEGPKGFGLAAFHRALLQHGTVAPACVRVLNDEGGVWAQGGGEGE